MGVEQRLVGKAVPLGKLAAIALDFGAFGELLRGQKAGFLKQRQVAIGIVVALDAGIAVPVPHPAEIARGVDVAKVGHARLGQMDRGQQSAKARTEHQHVKVLGHRVALDRRRQRIGGVIRNVAARDMVGRTHILRLPVAAQAPLTLVPVLFAQRGDVHIRRGWRFGRLATHDPLASFWHLQSRQPR